MYGANLPAVAALVLFDMANKTWNVRYRENDFWIAQYVSFQ